MAYSINMNETQTLVHAIEVAKTNPSGTPEAVIKKVFAALREIVADGEKS